MAPEKESGSPNKELLPGSVCAEKEKTQNVEVIRAADI